MSKKTAKLPKFLNDKITKTGYTRGADDDVIYQNRVSRNNTALIPYSLFSSCFNETYNEDFYEKGFIVLINPDDFYGIKGFQEQIEEQGLIIGENALLFYYSRSQWNKHNPHTMGLSPATSRTSPLGGQYVARVPSTTSADSKKIVEGFNTSKLKGAGIRVYEYASSENMQKCRTQLEFIYWQCIDSKKVSQEQGMTPEEIEEKIASNLKKAKKDSLNNVEQLTSKRILNENGVAVCPLCLEEISANGFYSKVAQAEGREVSDLTVTKLNLFHIEELRTGVFNHRPYNLGWGHHHCNVVVKDSGIDETIQWMDSVIKNNRDKGFITD